MRKKIMEMSSWVRVLVASLIMALLCSMVIVGVDTSWGTVDVKKGKTLSEQGTLINYKIYKPDSATSETPAPCIIFGVGGGDALDLAGMFATEASRRGYVFIALDATGNGLSENNDADTSHGFETVFDMATSLDYVDSERMILGGQSMGGVYSMDTSQAHQENVVLQVNIGMHHWGQADLGYDFNFAYIVGSSDESALVRTTNYSNLNEIIQSEGLKTVFGYDASQEIVVGEVSGDFATESARVVYTPHVLHIWEETAPSVLHDFLSVVTMSAEMPNEISIDNTIYMLKEIALLLMIIVFAMFAVAVAMLLLDTKLFESLKLINTPYAGLKKKSAQWWLAVIALIIISGFSLVWCYENNDNFSLIMQVGDTSGGKALWSIITGICLLAYTLIFHFAWGKKNDFGIREYGLATKKEEGFNAAYLLKACLFGVMFFAIVYGCYYLYYSITQCNIHWIIFEIAPMERQKFMHKFLLIMLFMLPLVFMNGIAQRTVVGFEESDAKGSVKALLLSNVISTVYLVGVHVVFVISNFVFYKAIFVNNRGYIGAENTWGIVIGCWIFNTVGYYINKKTGNIWAGTIASLLLIAWFCTTGPGMAF